MFKIKYKILLLLMLLAFAGNDAWAGGGGTDYWYYSNAKVETVPTGAGKVYAGKQNEAANPNNCVDAPHVFAGKSHKSQFPYNWYLNTLPTDSKKYKFLRWEDGNGNVISTDQNPQNSFKDNEGVKGGGNNTGESGDGATNPGTITMNFIAVYEEIINQYVSVESQNATYLTATIDKPENELGDEVTLWAYPNNYNSKFTGWSKDGEIVSMENPWTFTIDADNAGTYMATYKTGYNFYRFRNKETSRRFDAINDQGSISNFSSLQLVTGDVATYSAGTVIQIDMHHISGGDVYDYIMQGSHTSSYYNESGGEYMTMSLNSGDNTWNIYPNRQKAYMADEGGTNVSSSPYNNLDKSKWYIEPMDKDLETKENYFSLDPAKLVEVGGKYYTTLRTSWNILIDPERTKPYVVTSVDETAGTFEMEPINGNIIPAGTPVIIETKSKSIEENRMVPTTTAFTGTKPATNLLITSEKYFPNQSVSASSNYKKLMVNSNGQLAFGGDALTTVNGNEAYLPVAYDVVHDVQPALTETTLANLLENGEIGPNYKITDLTCVYAQNNVLYCKDDNNALKKSVKVEGETDYIKQLTGFQSQDWDQSNWIAITVPKGSEITTSILDHRLNNVVGRLKSKVNPEFEATMMPSAGEENAYAENTYITCNFSGEHQQGILNGNETNVFFVAPKPMEIAEVQWAMWDDNLKKFIIPIAAQGSQLQGAFSHNFSLLEAESEPVLIEGHVYHFPALIKVVEAAQGNAPQLAASDSNSWMVYPLEWYDDTPTAIGGMPAGKEVNRVVYYNLLGVASAVPFQGVNIVVTEYSDGTRQARKMVKR